MLFFGTRAAQKYGGTFDHITTFLCLLDTFFANTLRKRNLFGKYEEIGPSQKNFFDCVEHPMALPPAPPEEGTWGAEKVEKGKNQK